MMWPHARELHGLPAKQKLREMWMVSPTEPPEGTNHAKTLTLDFWPPQPGGLISVVYGTQFVILCNDSPWKLL